MIGAVMPESVTSSRLSLRALAVDAVILAVAVCAFYSVFLTGKRVSPGADLVNMFLPMKALTREAFASGVVPLWNPYIFCGVPFMATMQAAVFYPLNAPCVAFDNLVLGVNLYRLLHLWLLAMGVLVFLRVREGTPRPVAIGCALLMPCGTFMFGHLEHINQLAAIAWFPWWMLALWLCVKRPSVGVVAALGLTGGMQWLAGHPQQVIFTLLVSLAYLLAATIAGRERARWQSWLCAGAGVALAAGIGFVQILPATELSDQSLRVFDDYGFEQSWPPDDELPERYAALFSYKPRFLILAVRPHAFGNHRDGFTSTDNFFECGSYIGLLALGGALLGVVLAFWKRRRREHLFWLGVIVAAFVFAMGDATPLHWAASKLLAPLRHFRAPPRVLFLAMFGLTILSASGWSQIGEWIGRRGRLAAAVALWAFAAITFLDLRLVFRNDFSAMPVDARAMEAPKQWTALSSRLDGGRLFRLMLDDGDAYQDTRARGVALRASRVQPNSSWLGGIATVDGYEEGLLPLARRIDFDRAYFSNMFNRMPDPALLGLLGASHLIADRPVESPSLVFEPDLTASGYGASYAVLRNTMALPGVARLEEIERAIDLSRLDGAFTLSDGERMSGLNRSAARLDYRKAGFDDAGLAEVFRAAGEGVSTRRPDVNRLEARVDSSNGPFKGLVLQSPYPGWVVEQINGGKVASQELTPECAIASSFETPEGTKSATVAYRPWSFRLGAFVSLLAWGVLLAAMLLAWREKHDD